MNAEINRIALLVGALLALAGPMGACLAEPLAQGFPRPLIGSAKRADTELSWHNGELLKGEPVSADRTQIQYQVELFDAPMPLFHEALERLDFAGQSAPATGDFRFVFLDGSHLTGDLLGIDGSDVSLISSSCGELVVEFDQLLSIERIRGSGVVASGPAALLAGDSMGTGRFAKAPVFLSEAGEIVFLEFNGEVKLPIELPPKSLVRLRLRIEGEPAFALELAAKDQWVRLETWGDELVLRQGEAFASAGAITLSDERQIDLQVGWDQEAGSCTLFGESGEELAKLALTKAGKPAKRKTSLLGALPLIGGKIEKIMEETGVRPRSQPQKPVLSKGIKLSNQGAGFVVERYTITGWSGDPPPGTNRGAGGVELAGEFVRGTPTGGNGTSVIVETDQGDREIPLGEIGIMRWARPSFVGPERACARLWYSNGNLVKGSLLGLADGKLQFETAFTSSPLPASLELARALVFPDSGRQDEEAEELELERMDTITAGEMLLHGEMRPNGSLLPGFVPTGSDTAMTPKATGDLVLWRNLPPDGEYSRAPAILNTRSNEALPVSVDQFDAERIRFHWDPSEAREVATSEIYAVQFPEPAVKVAQGFEAGGWRILGRSKTAIKKTGEGTVLQPDTGIGHPFLLHGEDFGFSFKKEEHNASFRVRLFCQGTKRDSESINFLIAHYSNSVYAGIERGEDGQFSSNQSIQVGSSDDPVRLDFKFDGDTVEMLVNEVAVGSSKYEKKSGRKKGRGLVIETTSVWGNSFGSMKLLDFTMQGSPIGVAAPSFDEGAKREALLLPRLRRDVPPRHILIGRNGDLLRGEIGAKSDTDVLFRVGLEEYKVPIGRVAAAVWVEEADKVMDDVKNPPETAVVEEAPEEAPAPQVVSKEVLQDYSTQYLDLTNGGLLKLEVEAWGADGVIGDHEILGRCNIPPTLVHRVSLSPPRPSSAMISLSGWKFEHTVDPLPPGQEEADVSPLVGKPAPDFTLDMLEGEAFELSKAKGKVVVLDFWATWCAPCVRSLPHVIEAMAEFPADKVSFIAVNQGEAPKQVKQFMDIRGFEMPVGFDPEMKTGEQFGVESIPFTVVIDPAGTVTYVSLGASPGGAGKLADAVNKALSAGEAE